MKKRILSRVLLSAAAILATTVAHAVTTPAATLMSGNAALSQMASSDTAYTQATLGMRLAQTLVSLPGLLLLVTLVVIWGSLLLKKDTDNSNNS